jgi:hypothetical protein
MQKTTYLLVSQHVAGIIMPIIRRMVHYLLEVKLLDLRLCGKRTLPHYRGTEQMVAMCGICSALDVFANISPLVYYQIRFTNTNYETLLQFSHINNNSTHFAS